MSATLFLFLICFWFLPWRLSILENYCQGIGTNTLCSLESTSYTVWANNISTYTEELKDIEAIRFKSLINGQIALIISLINTSCIYIYTVINKDWCRISKHLWSMLLVEGFSPLLVWLDYCEYYLRINL